VYIHYSKSTERQIKRVEEQEREIPFPVFTFGLDNFIVCGKQRFHGLTTENAEVGSFCGRGFVNCPKQPIIFFTCAPFLPSLSVPVSIKVFL
jgi:hypothetical protein